MAKIAALTEPQPGDRREGWEVRDDQRRHTPADGDLLMEEILENLNTTPQEEVLKRIASLPRNRQDKVLAVRHQLRARTYELRDRLEWAIDRVIEDCVFVHDAGRYRRTSRRMTMTHCRQPADDRQRLDGE